MQINVLYQHNTKPTHFAFRQALDAESVSAIYKTFVMCGIEPVWFNNGTQSVPYDKQLRGRWRPIRLLPHCYNLNTVEGKEANAN